MGTKTEKKKKQNSITRHYCQQNKPDENGSFIFKTQSDLQIQTVI